MVSKYDGDYQRVAMLSLLCGGLLVLALAFVGIRGVPAFLLAGVIVTVIPALTYGWRVVAFGCLPLAFWVFGGVVGAIVTLIPAFAGAIRAQEVLNDAGYPRAGDLVVFGVPMTLFLIDAAIWVGVAVYAPRWLRAWLDWRHHNLTDPSV